MASAPFPTPPGYEWVYCTRFYHVRAKRYLDASAYEENAWCILVRRRTR